MTPSLRNLAVAVGAFAVVLSCRKPAPDELVYRGGSTQSASGGAAKPPPVAGPRPSAGGFDKQALLAAAGLCALDRFRAFEGAAIGLRDAARANASAPGNPAGLQQAWRAAMRVWQEAELFRFGPAARSTEPGGQDLRDQIDSWPLVSRCKIEEQLVSRAYAEPAFPTSLVNGRGLAAIEYLAFYTGTDNACGSFSTINRSGSWSALVGPELTRRRAEYAAAAADDVAVHAGALVAAWGGFQVQLASAGRGSTLFRTDQEGLNVLSDALFTMEKVVKDDKLARPLGFLGCETPRCPEAVESPYARASTSHLQANARGFRRLFQGCGENGEGLGFDDLLGAVGATDLEARMTKALAAVIATFDALDPPLEEALEVAPAKVEALHATLKVLTDQLKTEMVTVLDLALPSEVEGDND